MRRAALAASALFLALSLDRLAPEPPRAPDAAAPVRIADAVRAWPARDAGRFGLPGDPLTFALAGSPDAVRALFAGSGWTEIPTATRASVAAGLAELLAGETLAAFPPMNDYRVNGRRQDMNWAIPLKPLEARHHFRLWRTGQRDEKGRDLWWGSGNLDESIRWRDLSHVPDPNMPAERGFMLRSIGASPRVEATAFIPAPQVPLSGANDKGYAFRSDGRVLMIVLKPD